VLLGVILVTGLFFSVKWGMAAVSHEIAMYYLHSWDKKGHPSDMEGWDRSQKVMAFSIMLDSRNAGYVNDQGRFYEYAAKSSMWREEERDSFLVKAASSFRLATKLRPIWPIAWANLALAKSELGIVDDEYNRALTNAMRQGRAYPVIYEPIVKSAILSWPNLSEELKKKVIYQLKVALDSSAKSDVLAVIKAHTMCLEFERQGLSLDKHW